jgi:hypothetical protein
MHLGRLARAERSAEVRRGARKAHCDPINCGAKRAGGVTLALSASTAALA